MTERASRPVPDTGPARYDAATLGAMERGWGTRGHVRLVMAVEGGTIREALLHSVSETALRVVWKETRIMALADIADVLHASVVRGQR